MTDDQINTLMKLALEGVQTLNGIRADLHAINENVAAVANVVDTLDTNLGHHLGGISDAIEGSSQNIANQVAGLSGGLAAQLRQVIDEMQALGSR